MVRGGSGEWSLGSLRRSGWEGPLVDRSPVGAGASDHETQPPIVKTIAGRMSGRPLLHVVTETDRTDPG